jgi:hypothetical protein
MLEALGASSNPLETPPPEFLLASICADLSEHLPLGMLLNHFNYHGIYNSNLIEVNKKKRGTSWKIQKKSYINHHKPF